ncbi:serralysin [Palleronia marisminoris]|uniref:Serralysin C n=1 Tax=Palleronia marisminoris TaxID=315423 RepID=A0A1Y5RTL1_9RHOB|nr:M10 family metallopeptidase C-terminal domain-containing protein [Palleronia marisminoris]SFG49862.1 serralysin [Palleronia marisminoris]SLN24880.1 Serralysin C precursor [Palleronia marisminoris]
MASYTSNPFIDALTIGFRATNTVIDYYLDTSGGAWTQVEADAFADATALWSDVANIQFRRVHDLAQADFSESLYSDPDTPGQLGSHGIYLGDGETIFDVEIGEWGPLEGEYNRAGYGWDENDATGGLSRGGLGFTTILHEIGHGIGLDHSHADHSDDRYVFPGVGGNSSAQGENGLNSELYTLMSYRDGPDLRPTYSGYVHNWGKAGGPMAFDIAAIQNLYGANWSTRAGDDVYTLPSTDGLGTYWTAIWDAGGIDTIAHNGVEGAVIDLRTATLDNAPGGGGHVSRVGDTYGGFTVANGVTIENAVGGLAGDTLRGNWSRNHLSGRDGNDSLVGAGGDDTLEGGDGWDMLAGGGGDDLVFASNQEDLPTFDWLDQAELVALRTISVSMTFSDPIAMTDAPEADALFV